MGSKGGLLGVSGLSGDVRDLEQAADDGHERARLALDMFTSSIRHYLGAYLVELGGADASCSPAASARTAFAFGRPFAADWKSWASCSTKRPTPRRAARRRFSAAGSRTQIWIMPTNEELVVARQAKQLLESGG